MKNYFVYILANGRNGTLYIGVTNNLIRRISEHKNNINQGFTRRYNVHTFVYYESGESIEGAIMREKQLKKYGRKKKLNLIESSNPMWKDLYNELLE